MAIDSVQFATVYVNDLDLAKAWYSEALGLAVWADDAFPGGRWLALGPAEGGAGIALQPATDENPAGVHTGIVLGARDVAAAHQDLADRGVEFPMPPEVQDWGGTMGMLADPDGNVFVLHSQD